MTLVLFLWDKIKSQSCLPILYSLQILFYRSVGTYQYICFCYFKHIFFRATTVYGVFSFPKVSSPLLEWSSRGAYNVEEQLDSGIKEEQFSQIND